MFTYCSDLTEMIEIMNEKRIRFFDDLNLEDKLEFIKAYKRDMPNAPLTHQDIDE